MLGGFSRLWIYISLGCLELRRDALEGGEEEPSVLVVGTPLCGQLLAEVRDLILQTLDQRSSPFTLYIMSRLGLVFIQIDVDAVVFPLMVELSALYALSHRLYADAEGLRRLAGCHASSGQCRVSCTASVTYCPVKVTAPCYTSRGARAAQKTRPPRVRCLLGAVLCLRRHLTHALKDPPGTVSRPPCPLTTADRGRARRGATCPGARAHQSS